MGWLQGGRAQRLRSGPGTVLILVQVRWVNGSKEPTREGIMDPRTKPLGPGPDPVAAGDTADQEGGAERQRE